MIEDATDAQNPNGSCEVVERARRTAPTRRRRTATEEPAEDRQQEPRAAHASRGAFKRAAPGSNAAMYIGLGTLLIIIILLIILL